MRSTLVTLASALMLSIPACANEAVAQEKAFASASEVQSMIAAKKSGKLASLGPYEAALDYRMGAQPAQSDTLQAELIQVISGSGTLILGGTLDNVRKDSDRILSGTGITGGTRLKLEKGAAIFVPANTPHQLVDIQEPLASISIHVTGAAPLDPAKAKTFASAEDARAQIATGKNDTLVTLPPYRTVLQYRKEPQRALMHQNDSEFIYIAQGTGTFTVGGTLNEAKPTTPGNSSGTSITGGTPHKVAPGAVIFVSAGTPHQFSRIDGVIVSSNLHLPRRLGDELHGE